MLSFKNFLHKKTKIKIEKPELTGDTLHHSLSNHYKFSKDHIDTIKKLTSDDNKEEGQSEKINKHLRDMHAAGKKHINDFRVDKVDGLVNQHTTPHSFSVYTGTHHTIKPGIHHNASFLHTSTDPNTARIRSSLLNKKNNIGDKHIIKIHIPKDHPGAYISHHSRFSDEREFVLPRNTKLHVHAEHTTEEHFGQKIHTHHATIINHDE